MRWIYGKKKGRSGCGAAFFRASVTPDWMVEHGDVETLAREAARAPPETVPFGGMEL